MFVPPRPVWIDMTAAGMAGGFTPANTVPLRVRTGGAHLEQRMQGWQHAWLQSNDGRWVAVVSVRVSSANGQSHASIPLTVAATAIGPAATEADPMSCVPRRTRQITCRALVLLGFDVNASTMWAGMRPRGETSKPFVWAHSRI